MITRTFVNRPNAAAVTANKLDVFWQEDVESFARRGGGILKDDYSDHVNKNDSNEDDENDKGHGVGGTAAAAGAWRRKYMGRIPFWCYRQCHHNANLLQQVATRIPLAVKVSVAIVGVLILCCRILVWLLSSSQPDIFLHDLPAVDFVVGGFPKCGTTTLLYALRHHEDIVMPSHESCALKDDWRPEYRVRQRYRAEVQHEILQQFSTTTTNNNNNKITGIKCPTAIYSTNMMKRLDEIRQYGRRRRLQTIPKQPVKWIIGIRHPVWQVQSFYNYRITELYDKKVWWKNIRSLDDILFSSVPWKDMTSISHQFQHALANLLRFLQNSTSSSAFTNHSPTTATHTVFLYTMEQIQDHDDARSWEFRNDLSQFLGLSTTNNNHSKNTNSTFLTRSLGRENVNRFISGPLKHAEIIDICHTKFDNVRQKLVQDATTTALWIQNNLLLPLLPFSTDAVLVKVSNPWFVHHVLESWKQDPCKALFPSA